jgi:TBC domain-containing protein kinase-like protein
MELRSTKLHSDSYLALTSFVAARHPTESCGTNGLPLTPNSIAILGQSQRLKILSHPSLCTHLDCVRGKHERIVTVANCYKESLNDAAAGDRIKKGEDSLRKVGQI